MISKITWPHSPEKGNPFGGINGFRNLRITFHSGSFSDASFEETKALEMLYGLASLDNIDALSFDGEIYPRVVFGNIFNEKDHIEFRVVDQNNGALADGRTPVSRVDDNAILWLTGIYKPSDVQTNEIVRQNLLKAETHYFLHRDIFITLSPLLLKNREVLEHCNIYTPLQALKIVGLYLRMRGEFEWISEVQGKARFTTSRYNFYQFLSRGLLPKSWKYMSSLGLHPRHDELVQLGWSIIERFSRALQARDEIARLFYLPDTSGSEDQKSYHFDYLTLLLTSTLDVQALIMNKVYGFRLDDYNCGLRRRAFKEAVKSNPSSMNIDSLLEGNNGFIEILFKLRNKIHTTSLRTDISTPEIYPDELLDAIYQYNSSNHWGIQKQKVTVIQNKNPPVPSFKYSVDIYNLSCGLVDETCRLINSLMDETRIEDYLDKASVSKIKVSPPENILPYIESYLLLGK